MKNGGLVRFSLRLLAAMVVAVPVLCLAGCSAPPQIIAVDPDRGSIGIPANSPITVHFDRDVVHDSVKNRFSVSPSLGCDTHAAFGAPKTARCYVIWLSNEPGFTFYHPGAIFAPNDKYTFHLEGGIRSTDGTVNSLSHDWDETTAQAPQITGTTPDDRATGVPIDAPIIVSFSRAMAPAPTEAAISLSPPVVNSHVIPNSKDPTRFLLIPGSPLKRNTAYRLSVLRTARGIDGQTPVATQVFRFTTGGISAGPHAVAVVTNGNTHASSIELVGTSKANPYDPPAVEQLVTAPRGFKFLDSVISPQGRWYAATLQDKVTAATSIAVYDIYSGERVATVADAAMPSWSGDGTHVAFVSSSGVGVLTVATTSVQAMRVTADVTSRPQWILNDQLMFVVKSNDISTVDFADPISGAVYPAPSLPPVMGTPLSSGSSLVARVAASGSLAVLSLDSNNSLHILRTSAVPIGFSQSGTTLYAQAVGSLETLAVSDGATSQISGGPQSGDAKDLQVVPGGRQFAWITHANNRDVVLVANSDGSGTAPLTAFPIRTTVDYLDFN